MLWLDSLQRWLEERRLLCLDSLQRWLEERVVLWLDSLQRWLEGEDCYGWIICRDGFRRENRVL